MKKIIGIYVLIGLILSPLIYSNNGDSYRYTFAKGVGSAIGSSFYWPSYIFAWEPEINGKSEDEFTKSIVKMADWRNDKFFTGKRTNEHYFLMMSAIGSCLMKDNFPGGFKEIFMDNNPLVKGVKYDEMKKKIMNRFDGMDFKDVLDEGKDCDKN